MNILRLKKKNAKFAKNTCFTVDDHVCHINNKKLPTTSTIRKKKSQVDTFKITPTGSYQKCSIK